MPPTPPRRAMPAYRIRRRPTPGIRRVRPRVVRNRHARNRFRIPPANSPAPPHIPTTRRSTPSRPTPAPREPGTARPETGQARRDRCASTVRGRRVPAERVVRIGPQGVWKNPASAGWITPAKRAPATRPRVRRLTPARLGRIASVRSQPAMSVRPGPHPKTGPVRRDRPTNPVRRRSVPAAGAARTKRRAAEPSPGRARRVRVRRSARRILEATWRQGWTRPRPAWKAPVRRAPAASRGPHASARGVRSRRVTCVTRTVRRSARRILAVRARRRPARKVQPG